jgi:L,D-peptidoglycan transpeptidase YkuD (ErfK/YbiS/YcfS/YnhG family)
MNGVMALIFRLFKILAFVCAFAPQSGICAEPVVPRQVIVVVSESWSASGARLFRFERRAGKWEKAKGHIPVVVGEKGMGWGVGIVGGDPIFPIKKEGDGRAPAGLFPLLKVMGYEAVPLAAGFPYEQIVERTHCVDDPASALYTRIVKESDFNVPASELWKSSELMKRKDDLYKWLVVVGYNMKEPKPGAGSCIFMHIRRSSGTGTSGCTAMAEKDIVEILHWLKAEENPVLAQLPLPIYKRFWKEWKLPDPELLVD